MIQSCPHHRTGASLNSVQAKITKVGWTHLYLVDAREAVERRSKVPTGQDKSELQNERGKRVLEELGNWLYNNNRPVKEFRCAVDRYRAGAVDVRVQCST